MKGSPLPVSLLKDPVHLFALGFGSGLAPTAPGTVGTLVGVAIYAALPAMSLPVYLAFVLVTAAFGVWVCGRSARALGVHDHGGIVWDELVGYWITMIAAPAGWPWMALGFVLFRLFDIVKPWPIRLLDAKVHGGLGIMLDDILAGVFAAVCLQWLRMVL